MFRECYFDFNGRSSEEFGVFLVHADDGIFGRQFGAKRELVTEKLRYNPCPYSFGFEEQVLSGEIELGFVQPMGQKELRRIAKWLFQPDYCPFIADDTPDVVYYLVFSDENKLQMGTNDSGYITLSAQCDAPWGWSKKLEQRYDLRYNNGVFTFNINHVGNHPGYNALEMEIQIPHFDETDYPNAQTRPTVDKNELYYSIRNTRNTKPAEKFVLRSQPWNDYARKNPLEKGETVYIHMGKGELKTDQKNYVTRLDNCNKKFVSLEFGSNDIEVEGRCILSVRTQYPILL